MRFGWLAAAAAMVLGAGQASAATWITYTVSGAGPGSTVQPATGVSTSANFTYEASYTIDIDPSSGSGPYVSTGSSYGGFDGAIFLQARSQPGLLTFHSEPRADGIYSDFSVTIPATLNPTGFPASISSAATGTGSIDLYSRGGRVVSILGNVDRIISRAASGYIAPDISFAVAVPEPASWGMMILGFGLIGGSLRRRRTHAIPNFSL